MTKEKQNPATNYSAIAKVAAAGFLFLFGINALFYNKKHIKSPPEEVRYTQSAFLYFNNIRSYYYTKIEDTVSGFSLYHHKRFQSSLGDKDIDISLIINPDLQMAYLYPDLSDYKDSIKSAYIVVEGDTIVWYPANASDLKAEFIKLGRYIENSKVDLILWVNGQKVKDHLYNGKKSKKYLSELIFDYTKLTSGK